jgi:hypothetical protein
MIRSLLGILVVVSAVGALGAGPLAAATEGFDPPVENIAAQEVAKLLLVETIDEDGTRWEADTLQAFVDDLGIDHTESLVVEVDEAAGAPALAVKVDAGSGARERCIVPDDDGIPTPSAEPCADHG